MGVDTTLDDPRIGESSGLACSPTYPGIAYTMNDEGKTPHIYVINLVTKSTIAVINLHGAKLKDPEAIRINPITGKLWLADTGNNDLDRKDQALYEFDEPEIDLDAPVETYTVTNYKRYPLVYDDTKKTRNIEGMAIHPTTGKIVLVSKASPKGELFEVTTKNGKAYLKNRKHVMPELVTDIAYVRSAKYLLLRQKTKPDKVVILKSSFNYAKTLNVPRMSKPESIDIDAAGESFWVGSEGKYAPLREIVLAEEYR
jgi:hypothetical protein